MQKALLLSFQPSVTKVIPVTENASNIKFFHYTVKVKKTIFLKDLGKQKKTLVTKTD